MFFGSYGSGFSFATPPLNSERWGPTGCCSSRTRGRGEESEGPQEMASQHLGFPMSRTFLWELPKSTGGSMSPPYVSCSGTCKQGNWGKGVQNFFLFKKAFSRPSVSSFLLMKTEKIPDIFCDLSLRSLSCHRSPLENIKLKCRGRYFCKK